MQVLTDLRILRGPARDCLKQDGQDVQDVQDKSGWGSAQRLWLQGIFRSART